MKLLSTLEELLAALSRGDARAAERLGRKTASLFGEGIRALSAEELTLAMELHQRCSRAAAALRAE
jgi:hypothetical protein